MSKMFLKTLREAPSDAELPSHRLLLRAGLISPLAAGLYSFTPLGWKVLRNVERIIREEMDRSGAQEVHLPALHPMELWEKTGRAQAMGAVLLRVRDRREREFALGPTHEEVISTLVASQLQSYRDLPVTLYQIQSKFRDEPRPRGGLIRLREFFMKDAYSFDPDWESLDASYLAAYEAYVRIFARAGVPVVAVEADSGAIGGKDSQEFMYLNELGEDEILLCSDCGYAANVEKAVFRPEAPVAGEPAAMERVGTPGKTTIADVAAFLGVEPRQTLKVVLYEADGQLVIVTIRGDLEVNEIKVMNVLKATKLAVMEEAAVRRAGLVAGYASPVGQGRLRVVADPSAVEAVNLVAGANEADAHLRNVNYGRDWTAETVADVALARAGNRCDRCGGTLESHRGMELGHVFKLGTMYSEALDVRFLDEDGKQQLAVMGCYGIGVERLLAAVIEANHDDDGITWPSEVAPFDVHVVAIQHDRDEVAAALADIEQRLSDAGLKALVDDRVESPGAKFKDADLLGMPIRVTVSPRALEHGGVEFKPRREKDAEIVPIEGVVMHIEAALADDGSRH